MLISIILFIILTTELINDKIIVSQTLLRGVLLWKLKKETYLIRTYFQPTRVAKKLSGVKAWSIPDLRGSKHDWFILTRELLKLVENGQAVELDSYPQINSISNLQTWRTYAAFLKGMGLVRNQAGVLSLTEIGVAFQHQPTQCAFANIIHNKVRLFGEVLAIVRYAPATVEEVDTLLRKIII